MFLGHGYIQVKDGVRIIADLDLIRYYHRLIDYYNYRTERLQLPAHGAHITIVNPKLHRGVLFNSALQYHGKRVTFNYFPEKAYISNVNYWIPVTCKFADELKNKLGVDDGKNYWGLHLTICNKKFDSK